MYRIIYIYIYVSNHIYIYIYIYIYICIESYERLKKSYLISLCLTLGMIRYR